MSETKGPPVLPGEVWRSASGRTVVTVDNDRTARAWGEGRELFGESRAVAVEAWALSERTRADRLEAEARDLAHTAAHEAERAVKAERLAAAERALRKAEADYTRAFNRSGRSALRDAAGAYEALENARAALRLAGGSP